jgi:hypothetical protein
VKTIDVEICNQRVEKMTVTFRPFFFKQHRAEYYRRLDGVHGIEGVRLFRKGSATPVVHPLFFRPILPA